MECVGWAEIDQNWIQWLATVNFVVESRESRIFLDRLNANLSAAL